MKSCEKENFGMTKLLIAHFRDAIDINVKDRFGRTAIHYASFSSNHRICQLLIDNFKASIYVNMQDIAGNTALHYIYINSYLQFAY